MAKKMEFDSIRSYWNRRAALDPTVQSTTQDVYLRDIEYRVMRRVSEAVKPRRVLDIGCGDGLTTAKLAKELPQTSFVGFDYSENMIRNASRNIERFGTSNLQVRIADVTKFVPEGLFDLAYTTRCLINLPSWELQVVALNRIADCLEKGGHYAMIENFVEGQKAFNELRLEFGLAPIPVRDHNNFFSAAQVIDELNERFDLIESLNISSSYYLVSRLVYSKICQLNNVEPDYLDPHHEWGARLPFSGEHGPVRLMLWRKR
jgi:ubiquinone/menaquinone biosynthesis C-methylase UbiE